MTDKGEQRRSPESIAARYELIAANEEKRSL